jgi:two-component system response regulator NreC
MSDSIRIVVVDDHTLMRQGLVGLMNAQADIEVVGEAGDAATALALLAREDPAVVLLDLGLPDIGGLELAVRIRHEFPAIRVLIVTMHEREDYLFQALQAGASGYVLKGADVDDLILALRSVHRGDIYVDRSLTGTLVKDHLGRMDLDGDRAAYDGLSEREREVLKLIADGLTTAQIGESMHLSPHTVQSHRDHIMTKLDLHSTVALTKYALRKGLIQLEP